MRYSFSRRYKAAPAHKDNAEVRSLKFGLLLLTVFHFIKPPGRDFHYFELASTAFRIDREIDARTVFFKIWSLAHKLIFNLFNNQH